jgi:hypothetical protein
LGNGAACGCDLSVEVLTQPLKACLKASPEPLALRHAYLTDPTILHNAESAEKHNESTDNQPRKQGAPSVHREYRLFTVCAL